MLDTFLIPLLLVWVADGAVGSIEPGSSNQERFAPRGRLVRVEQNRANDNSNGDESENSKSIGEPVGTRSQMFRPGDTRHTMDVDYLGLLDRERVQATPPVPSSAGSKEKSWVSQGIVRQANVRTEPDRSNILASSLMGVGKGADMASRREQTDEPPEVASVTAVSVIKTQLYTTVAATCGLTTQSGICVCAALRSEEPDPKIADMLPPFGALAEVANLTGRSEEPFPDFPISSLDTLASSAPVRGKGGWAVMHVPVAQGQKLSPGDNVDVICRGGPSLTKVFGLGPDDIVKLSSSMRVGAGTLPARPSALSKDAVPALRAVEAAMSQVEQGTLMHLDAAVWREKAALAVQTAFDQLVKFVGVGEKVEFEAPSLGVAVKRVLGSEEGTAVMSMTSIAGDEEIAHAAADVTPSEVTKLKSVFENELDETVLVAATPRGTLAAEMETHGEHTSGYATHALTRLGDVFMLGIARCRAAYVPSAVQVSASTFQVAMAGLAHEGGRGPPTTASADEDGSSNTSDGKEPWEDIPGYDGKYKKDGAAPKYFSDYRRKACEEPMQAEAQIAVPWRKTGVLIDELRNAQHRTSAVLTEGVAFEEIGGRKHTHQKNEVCCLLVAPGVGAPVANGNITSTGACRAIGFDNAQLMCECRASPAVAENGGSAGYSEFTVAASMRPMLGKLDPNCVMLEAEMVESIGLVQFWSVVIPPLIISALLAFAAWRDAQPTAANMQRMEYVKRQLLFEHRGAEIETGVGAAVMSIVGGIFCRKPPEDYPFGDMMRMVREIRVMKARSAFIPRVFREVYPFMFWDFQTTFKHTVLKFLPIFRMIKPSYHCTTTEVALEYATYFAGAVFVSAYLMKPEPFQAPGLEEFPPGDQELQNLHHGFLRNLDILWVSVKSLIYTLPFVLAVSYSFDKQILVGPQYKEMKERTAALKSYGMYAKIARAVCLLYLICVSTYITYFLLSEVRSLDAMTDWLWVQALQILQQMLFFPVFTAFLVACVVSWVRGSENFDVFFDYSYYNLCFSDQIHSEVSTQLIYFKAALRGIDLEREKEWKQWREFTTEHRGAKGKAPAASSSYFLGSSSRPAGGAGAPQFTGGPQPDEEPDGEPVQRQQPGQSSQPGRSRR